jgi:hypothetical protein
MADLTFQQQDTIQVLHNNIAVSIKLILAIVLFLIIVVAS